MSRFAYLGVLRVRASSAPAWLEVLLRTRVYAPLAPAAARRSLPVVVVFCLWDLYAIASGHWTFDPERTTGVLLPGGLPLDEVLFFVVIPIAALLTLEAVRSVKRWEVGDEPPGAVRGRRTAGRLMTLHAARGARRRSSWSCSTWPWCARGCCARRVFWASYAIVVFFQLVTNGVLTGLAHRALRRRADHRLLHARPTARRRSSATAASRSRRWRTSCSGSRSSC